MRAPNAQGLEKTHVDHLRKQEHERESEKGNTNGACEKDNDKGRGTDLAKRTGPTWNEYCQFIAFYQQRNKSRVF